MRFPLAQITTRAKRWLADKLAETTNIPALIGRGLASAAALNVNNIFQVSYERTAVHKDMTRMDGDDEIVTFALDAISSRALGYEDRTIDAFTVLIEPKGGGDRGSKEEQAQDILNDLIERCRLRPEAWQIIRRFVKYGNEFREIIYDFDNMQIAGIKLLPEHTVWPNTDDKGNRKPGYTQRPEYAPSDVAGVEFKEYEIVHFPYGEIDNYVGTPLLKSARKNWKRLNLAEDITAIARLIRAFMKLIHKVPVGSDWSPKQKEEALSSYKKTMTERKFFDQDLDAILSAQSPQTVTTDMYIPDDGTQRGGVEMIDPENAQLQNITDIKHFMDRLITATHVPKRYFPFEGSTPKLSEGGGTAEDKHFACLLMMCQMILKAGYEKLFNLELILHGLNPKDFKYLWRMANISTTDQFRAAQIDLNLAKALEVLSKVWPGLAEHPEVAIREYTSISDTSAETLLKADLKPAVARIVPKNGKNGGSPRVDLPGDGMGDEAREKV